MRNEFSTMELNGKIALITGGTKGIGAASAIDFAKQGADIALNGRNDDADAAKVKAEVQALGRRCEVLVGDCAKPEESRELISRTINAMGDLDILVHSAGKSEPGPFLDYSTESWMAAFDLHVHAIFHMCQEVIPHFQTKKESAIMLISSVAGIRGLNSSLLYAMVKGAIPQFTRCLAFEYAAYNIRVNCVAPGIIRTRFHDGMTPEQKKNNLENRIPLGIEGTPEQVATLITELVKNDLITGEIVSIDGGLTMRIA